jgi:hypothetical protein
VRFATMIAAVALATTSCLLFQDGRPRTYPTWSVTDRTVQLGCAQARARVVRSGKQGVGLVVDLEGQSTTCKFALREAEMTLQGEVRRAQIMVAPARIAPGTRLSVYVPIAFDGDDAWNRGAHDARLVLRATVDGKEVEGIGLAMTHAFLGGEP